MGTKSFLNVFVLVFLSTGLLSACSNSSSLTLLPVSQGNSTLLATGGAGSTGTGGHGGELYVESTGAVNILKSGSVDAGFVVSDPTPSFGTMHAVVSGGTATVLLDTDGGVAGTLCTATGGSGLYVGVGDGTCGNGDQVTGLTVEAGATLVLVDQGFWGGYATLQMTNDMAINGTLTADSGKSLYIEANLVLVGSGGRIITSAITTDTAATAMYLGDGSTGTIINHGTIEAKGLGSGNGGYVYMEADDLVVNFGTIDVSGGSSDAGDGGSCSQWYSLEIYVDYGNFYSSGAIRMNGGNGALAGGNAGQAWIETADSDNTHDMNGDILLSGTVEAIGGNGDAGNGGSYGYLGFETDAMGKVAVNATMTVRGGNGTGAGTTGGSPYGVDFYSYNDDSLDVATPGKIRVSGNFDLRGGDGDLNGGAAGYLEGYSYGANSASNGVDVEFVGFPLLNLNGGDGANGGAGSDWAVEIYPASPGGSAPAGAITNQATIQAKGGNSTAGGTGGRGGYIEMYFSGTADATTVINNTGTIDISGGTGDTGGDTYGYSGGDSIYLEAQHVENSGSIIADGGGGDTTGGGGGDITMWSDDITTPTTPGTLSAAGGAPGGTAGYIYVDGSSI